MFTSGTAPPSGVKLSCDEMTEPVEVPVVDAAKRPDAAGRSAPPCPRSSRASRRAERLDARSCRLLSKPMASAADASQSTNIAANSAQPWRWSRTIRPNAYVSANGIASSAQISRKFVKPLGFSNGWAEFALYGPPPFVPSSLIASWLAIGPPGIDCVRTLDVVDLREAVEVLHDALAHEDEREHDRERERARARSIRVRSTQKLPIVSARRRARPRTSATATAMPDGGRDEVLDREPRHLREVAHRRLARVVLPVRVRDEARRRVERERRRHAAARRSG